MRRVILALVAVAATAVASHAYDGPPWTALPATGLEAGYRADLLVRPERIVVDAERIVWRYRVENMGLDERPVRLVASVPPVGVEHREPVGTLAATFEVRPLGLQLRLDGRPLEPLLQRRAVARGLDVSGTLAALDVPLLPFGAALDRRLAALSEADREMLRSLDLVRYRDDGAGLRPVAAWMFEATYHWQVPFPAGSKRVVELVHAPILGRMIDTPMAILGKVGLGLDGSPLDALCLDDDAVAQVEHRLLKAANAGGWQGYEGRYLPLRLPDPGGAWSMGYSGVEVVVDPGDDDASVGLCAAAGERLSLTGEGGATRRWTAPLVRLDGSLLVDILSPTVRGKR